MTKSEPELQSGAYKTTSEQIVLDPNRKYIIDGINDINNYTLKYDRKKQKLRTILKKIKRGIII